MDVMFLIEPLPEWHHHVQQHLVAISHQQRPGHVKSSMSKDCSHTLPGKAGVERKGTNTYGGSFLYHLDQDRIALGYVSGLDYSDPEFKPWEAFQQWKNHPHVAPLLRSEEHTSELQPLM